MSFNTLDCGTFDCFSPITGSALTIPKGFWLPGTAAIYQGYFGTTSILNYAMGTCNVGMSPTAPFAYTGAAGNVNFHNLSLTTYMGDHLVVGRSSVAGSELRANVANVHLVGANTTIVGAKTSIAGAKTDVSGAVCNINGPAINIGGRNWYASAASWDSKKGFDIPHPTKENHRLRYICIEGPTADVHIRGKSKSNTIELPDYWIGLVDLESITVSLTPIGSYQELFVETIDWEKGIVIGNNSGDQFNYQYTVFAERIDGEKNIPEYEGLTIADYPGDNSQYRINAN
jgi:hypothetical protein